KLTWEGLIELQGDRISRLLLLANGTEKLKWGNQSWALQGEADVAHLPAGHAIDLACGVRYGILGEPIPPDEAAAPGERAPAQGPPGDQVPEEVRRQLLEALGTPFLVFRDKVQAELKLSDAQRERLEQRLREQVQDTMPFLKRLQGQKPEERDKELQEYRQKAQAKLTGFLKDELKPDQLKRFRQLMFQREGPFALLSPEVSG